MLLSLLVAFVPMPIDTLVPSLSIVVAQASTTDIRSDMTLANCQPVQTPDNPNGQLGGGFSPAAALYKYWYRKFHEMLPVKDAKVTVLEGPQHGELKDDIPDKIFGPSFHYVPNTGFLGPDKITFLVEVDGKRARVVTTLIVEDNLDAHDDPCYAVKQQTTTK